MVTLACAVVAYLRSLFLPRHKLALEAVALRQQLAVFKRKQTRPKLDRLDRLFWIVLRRLWEGWSEALIIVKPETVVSWHRAGFQRFWRWRSQGRRPGRPQVNAQIRQLIRRMKEDNPHGVRLAFTANCSVMGRQFPHPVFRFISKPKTVVGLGESKSAGGLF